MNKSVIFQSIKSALQKEKAQSTGGDFLKTEVGNTYLVRLLPAKNPEHTFFHYYQHGWVSFSTQQYVGAVSLQTFKERDPIAEERFRLLRGNDPVLKEKAEKIRRAEKWLVNVYVVNDPVNPDNNGKVKILRFGKQLHTVIMDAIDGDSAEELGSRVFDLSPNGVNLRVKVDAQGDFPSFVQSKFSLPAEIKDMTEEKMAKIYDGVFDLQKVLAVQTADQLKAMLVEHFHCTSTDSAPESETQPEAPVTPTAKKTAPKGKKVDVDADDEVDKILKELDTA